MTVTAARKNGGDTDLSISGSPLTFTDANWNTAQTLTVSAAEDGDTTAGSATFEHSASSGDSSYDGASITISELVANEVDNDTPDTSEPSGASGSNEVSQPPLNLIAIPGDQYVTLSWDPVPGVGEDNWLHCWWRYCHGTWFWERPTLGDDGRWSARVTGWDIGHGEPPRPSLTNGRTYTFYVTPCLAECHDLNERRDIVYGTPGGPVDVKWITTLRASPSPAHRWLWTRPVPTPTPWC